MNNRQKRWREWLEKRWAEVVIGLFVVCLVTPHMARILAGGWAGIAATVIVFIVWPMLVPMTCINGGNFLTSTLSMYILMNNVVSFCMGIWSLVRK